MASGSPTAFFHGQDTSSNSTTATMPGASPNEIDYSIAPRLRAIVIIFELLCLIAIALRFVARWISKHSYGWDDWLAVLAGILSIVNMANDVVIIGLGAGTHLSQIDPKNMTSFLISVYVGQVIYAPIIASIKLSILFLYLRLFNPNRTFCKLVYGLIALTAMWGIAVFITTVLQCLPISAAWNKALVPEAHCINLPAFMMGSNIPDILLDIAILVLPAPMIWKLKVPTSKKIAILSIFLLAAFDLIMAIVRLASLATFNEDDPTWGFTQPMIWSTVEINVGLICACLPVMTPIFQKLFGKWLESWSTKGSSHRSKGNGNGGTRRAVTVNDIGKPSDFRRLGDEEDGMSAMLHKGAFEQKSAYEMSSPPRPPPPSNRLSVIIPKRPVAPIRPMSGVPF